jgi:VWFA-related protein
MRPASRIKLLPRWVLLLFMVRLGFGQPPSTGEPTIQGSTHLVLVNVVVKDKHGKPVDDLKLNDFELRDQGERRKIAFFSLERSGEGAGSAANSQPRLTFTNRPAPSVAVTVFLFDELNTKFTDQEFAKKDFLRYLRGLPANSRVAVFVLGDSLTLLHDFSQDMPSLLAAISKHSNRVNPEVQASTSAPASSNSLTGDAATTSQWDSFLQSSSQPYMDYAETVRATRTAAALETIAGHLQGIPGRKTLIWISGGFPIQLGLHNTVDSMAQSNPNDRRSTGARGKPATKTTQPSTSAQTTLSEDLPGMGTSFAAEVKRAIRSLNEADVAVYPVDARGISVPSPFEADRGSIGKRSSPPKTFLAPDFNYETLETLAQETGGRAFHQINDLNSAIQEAADDSRVTYSLAFSPAASQLDGSYHQLVVSVNRPGVSLRYRPGYVASKDVALSPTLAEAIANPIALTGVGFTVHLDPTEGGYKAAITLDAHTLTLEPTDGKWIGSLQFLVVVGKVEQLTTIPLSFSESMFHQVLEKGLVLGARVKTPPGTTGFNMGFRDIPSGAVGTLHVPL